MANPIIKIKRGTTVPSAGQLQAGEFAIDKAAKNLYLGIDDGMGNITNEVVGGEGTFATKAYVTSVTGALGDMSQQFKNAVDITGGTINGTSIGATTASSGKFTTITTSGSGTSEMGNLSVQSVLTGLVGDDLYVGSNIALISGANTIKGLTAPTTSDHAANKGYVDSAISALGSVFHYVGDVSSASTPLDLSTLSDTNTGAYYKVDVDGAYTDGATTFNAKVGDAFVKTTTGWQKLDNVDVVVSHEAGGEITVTGTEDTGYVVKLNTGAGSWKDSVDTDITDLETKTQNIDLAGTTSGTTQINGDIKLNGTSGATVIKATPGGRGIVVGSSVGNEMFLSASGASAVVSAIGTNNLLTLNGSYVNIGGSFDPSVWPPIGQHTDDATEVTINAVTVKGSASGTTTLENFVIDGGTY